MEAWRREFYHWALGQTARNHKYTDRYKDNKGNWVYVYAQKAADAVGRAAESVARAEDKALDAAGKALNSQPVVSAIGAFLSRIITHPVDQAIANKVNYDVQNWLDNKKTESESALLRRKDDTKATRQEDQREVNRNFDINNYKVTNNCAHCAVAYDLRRKGYNAEAKEDNIPGELTPYFKKMYPYNRMSDLIVKEKLPYDQDISYDKSGNIHRKSEEEYVNKIVRNITGEDKKSRKYTPRGTKADNNRKPRTGILLVAWDRGGAHALNYEIDRKGNLHIIDTQIKHAKLTPEQERAQISAMGFIPKDHYTGRDLEQMLSHTTAVQYIETTDAAINKQMARRYNSKNR